VIIDLTPIRDGTGPARLLDMVEGRSEQAFKTWLSEPFESPRDAMELVAMDGFTGFKTVTTEELPDAVAVMAPSTSPVWPATPWTGAVAGSRKPPMANRGHKDDLLYSARRAVHTGAGLLTDRQRQRLSGLFATEQHVEVEATWGTYQRIMRPAACPTAHVDEG
jgi:hypothetical protein